MNSDNLGNLLKEEQYIRPRLNPSPGDYFYIHLKDLLANVKLQALGDFKDILDLGSGGSPYQSLFKNTRYKRADLPGDKSVDYVVNEDGSNSAPTSSFDLVISTQVLEHVPNVRLYLNECHRTLRKNGRLFLTTHGFFQEHSCPGDFYRWTLEGLKLEVANAGFHIEESKKMTVGGRAAAQLLPATN
ncbi:MAG: methyltransferase domain-containing protein [Nitrospira sp.]